MKTSRMPRTEQHARGGFSFRLMAMLLLCLSVAITLPLLAACKGGSPGETGESADSDAQTGTTMNPVTDSATDAASSTATSGAETAATEPITADPAKNPISEERPMRDNITLNAYLIPLMTQELRDEMMQLCKDADIDVLSHVYVKQPWVATDHTFEWYKQAMADAARYGLLLETRDYDVQNAGSKSDEELIAIAKKYKDLPGFGGFFVVDEPYNPSPFARVENAFRSICPNAFININFLPCGSYPSQDVYMRQLCDFGGLLTHGGTLSLDAYCFPEGGGVDERSLFTNYDILRQAGLYTGTDTAVYVQSVGNTGHYRRPSANDLRYNMMVALAYGVKEIKFFTWGTPPGGEGVYTDAILDRNNKPTELYYEVCQINKKIHALGSYLVACDAVQVYHALPKTTDVYDLVPSDLFVQVENGDLMISLMEERKDANEYLFVVNKDFKEEQTVELAFRGIDTIWLANDTTGEWIETKLTNGKLSLTMAAGDAALIKLPAGDFIRSKAETNKNTNLALHAPVKATDSVGADGYYLYNLTDGITDSAEAARTNISNERDQMFTIDLGAVKSINRIDLYPSGVGPVCGLFTPTVFRLLISQDGKNWQEVASNEQPLSREFVSVFRFDECQARYVRIWIAGTDSSIGIVEIGELMVYTMDDGSIQDQIPTSYVKEEIKEGQNLALRKPVVDYSSTTDVPAWNCHHNFITDGDATTAWASELYRNERPRSTEWITIDLLGVYDIHCVKLTPRGIWNGVNVFPEDYEIQVSLDGKQFVTVASVTGDNQPQTQDIRVLEFEGVPARYVRLYATRLTASSTANAGYCIEMSELEVFGGIHDPALSFPKQE